MLPVISAVVIGGFLVGVGAVSAQNVDGTQTLVSKIAQKFNLKEADVQAVFDEDKAAHRNQMQQKHQEYLSSLVTEGKITESQKQLILQKQAELIQQKQQEFENLKNLTPDERKAQMEVKKQELENWAKQNGIDISYLLPRFGMKDHGMFGFHKGGRGGMSPSVTPNPNQ